MGHNINIRNGKASFMYYGEAPWHRLGTRLDQPATAKEAIEAAGLDFTVEKVAIKTEPGDFPVPRYYATVRTDSNTVLGVVGSRYTPIQNRDAFVTFDALVGADEAIYHTAGVLGEGERIWILAKLPDYIRVRGDDVVEKYLLLSNTHDGSSPVRVKLTPIRVVCQNTLSVALYGSEQEVRIRHTNGAEAKLAHAYEILGLTNHLYGQLETIFKGMAQKRIDQREGSRYVTGVFRNDPPILSINRLKPVHDKIFELMETGSGSGETRGTLWGAYNAITECVDHIRRSTVLNDRHLNSVWFGRGEAIKKRAFQAAVDMLN